MNESIWGQKKNFAFPFESVSTDEDVLTSFGHFGVELHTTEAACERYTKLRNLFTYYRTIAPNTWNERPKTFFNILPQAFFGKFVSHLIFGGKHSPTSISCTQK